MISTYLTDILVSDTADLLDIGGALGHILQGVTGELELVLDVGGGDDVDAGAGRNAANELLTQEVADLDVGAAGLSVLLEVDVDGEMGVDVAHLVQEATGNTDDQVVDDGADGAEGSNTLASTVVQLDRDDVLLGATEGNGDVGQVLDELATGALDGHNPRTNVNLHCRAKKKKSQRMFDFPRSVRIFAWYTGKGWTKKIALCALQLFQNTQNVSSSAWPRSRIAERCEVPRRQRKIKIKISTSCVRDSSDIAQSIELSPIGLSLSQIMFAPKCRARVVICSSQKRHSTAIARRKLPPISHKCTHIISFATLESGTSSQQNK